MRFCLITILCTMLLACDDPRSVLQRMELHSVIEKHRALWQGKAKSTYQYVMNVKHLNCRRVDSADVLKVSVVGKQVVNVEHILLSDLAEMDIDALTVEQVFDSLVRYKNAGRLLLDEKLDASTQVHFDPVLGYPTEFSVRDSHNGCAAVKFQISEFI